MLADLAVAPFPASLVRPPLRRVGMEIGLPPLGDYQVRLIRRAACGPACDALAGHVANRFMAGGRH